MGYKQVGISANGKKKFKITIELGVDIFGKRQRMTRIFEGTLAEVKIKDAELTNQYYKKKNHSNVNDLTFSQYSEIFLKKYCEGNLSLITIDNYKRLLKYVLSIIGNYKLKKINHIILDEMYRKLKKGVKGKELSQSAMYDYYKLINVMFNRAVYWELLTSNPNKKVPKPKKEKKEQKFYDLDQIEKLLLCLDNECIKYKALIILALDSGARRGEICALKWNDVDLDKGILRIDNSLKVVKGVVDEKKAKTSSSVRMIYLSKSTINVLQEYKKWQDSYIKCMGKKWKGTNRIFTSKFGSHMNPNTCYRIFSSILKKYGLEHIRFHDIRHTTASLLISEGVNLKAVSERLGHSSTNITSDIYTHIFESDRIRSANAFDRIVKNS